MMTEEQKLRGNIRFCAENFARLDHTALFSDSKYVQQWALDALASLKEAIAEYEEYMKGKESDQ